MTRIQVNHVASSISLLTTNNLKIEGFWQARRRVNDCLEQRFLTNLGWQGNIRLHQPDSQGSYGHHALQNDMVHWVDWSHIKS